MCGLAGWVDYTRKNADIENLQKMSQALAARAPYGSIYTDGICSLIHRSCSKDTAQPYSVGNSGQQYTIALNGELYNAGEVQAELRHLGVQLAGNTDAELILQAYMRWGEDCLIRFNGVFAFVIWDNNAKTLFAARDRGGVKPFFFFEHNGGIIFASEIKALLASGVVPAEVDKVGLYNMLLLAPGRPCGSGCIKGVYELIPGECLRLDRNGISRKIYWRLTAAPHKDNPAESVAKVRWLITDAITRRLDSDAPLACFLSGGLDSSIISYIAAEKFKEKGKILTTYSVDYQDNDKYFVSNSFQPDADKSFIQIMSDAIGSRHKYIELDNTAVADALQEAALARDLPGMADIDSSLLLFCREIKEHSVCVSGECADELFGGYPWYHNPDILYKDSFPWANSVDLRKRLFAEGLLGSDADDYLHSLYQNTVDSADCLPDDDKLNRRMRQMFALNYYWFMQTLVDRKDRMTMHGGIQARVPFCDHRLVEYAYNMPWDIKSLSGREKGVMRLAFADLLPPAVALRKKSPYPKTFSPAFFDKVANTTLTLAEDKNSILNTLVNKQTLTELKARPDSIQTPWYGQLMRTPQIFGFLIQLDTVFREYGLKLV